MRAINLLVRFLLELCLLAAFGFVGWRAAGGGVPGAVVGALLVLAVATLWGLLLAPKRNFELAAPVRVACEAALFAGAGAGLVATGHGALGAALAAAWLANRALLRASEVDPAA